MCSSEESDSEDDVIREARLVLSDSINARLYRENPNPPPQPIRNVNSNNNINLARATPQNNDIGNRMVNGRIERLQVRSKNEISNLITLLNMLFR